MSLVNKASGVALICGKLILLGKRPKEVNGVKISFGGYWSIFGGALEKGESLAECAARELLEETQIKVAVSDLIRIGVLTNSNTEFYVHICKTTSPISPSLNSEHTESGWFNINSLSSFPENIDAEMVDLLLNNV